VYTLVNTNPKHKTANPGYLDLWSLGKHWEQEDICYFGRLEALLRCFVMIEIVYVLLEVTNTFTNSCQICDDPWKGNKKNLIYVLFQIMISLHKSPSHHLNISLIPRGRDTRPTNNEREKVNKPLSTTDYPAGRNDIVTPQFII